ncbi:hypothetical protein GALMADRAFT_250505 [Galerina marginata CBS 339.88]|uniref:Uncharacterized protein n=1 Tax=Galerina marginata (strain CBS 339.88) TaxID=685588 RepID=A0A067SUB4_GALM3|nr:hypothetical protein GALMADRAFT_250505 [Galerina marginata CBS 339.88]
MLERKRRDEEKFTPPPVRYERKEGGRDRSCSAPVKPAMRYSANPPPNTQDRKSSLSSSPSKSKRVSWASSTSTLDVAGSASEKPVDKKVSPRSSFGSPFHPIPSYTPIPKARTSTPRSSMSVEPRSRRGPEMIAATTPDMAISWAKPDEPFVSRCDCGGVDPLYVYVPYTDYCQMHPYRD